jgi:hypothetical protein
MRIPNFFDEIFICSDRKRRGYSYFIAVDTLIELFRDVGGEGIFGKEMRRNTAGEMEFVNIIDMEGYAKLSLKK